jgi:phosphatidylglycerol:prolipoprotein diacylglycerol transferase
MAYPNGTVATTEEVHPTPIYESLIMGTAGLVLWHLRDRFRPGVLFAIYLVIAGLERFLIEFIRRNDAAVLGLTEAQLISLVMVTGGAVWIFRARRDGGLGAKPATAA